MIDKVLAKKYLIVELSAILLFGWYLLSFFVHKCDSSISFLPNICLCAGLFYIIKILRCKAKKKFLTLIYVVICFVGIYESIYGILQVFGVILSHNASFTLTGTFSNPGPYGGFEAVVASIAISYILSDNYFSSHRNKLLKILSYVAVFSCLIVLPASRSRAAWLAIIVAVSLSLIKNAKFMSWAKSKRRLPLIVAAIAVVFCILSFYSKKDSALGRFHIWNIELRAIAHHPLSGTGPHTSMGTYGREQMAFFIEKPRSQFIERVAGCPEYPFNVYLGIGVETGVIGLILSLTIIAVAIMSLSEKQSIFAAGLIAWAIFAFFSYPLDVPLLTIVLVLMLCEASLPPVVSLERRDLTGAVAFLLVSLLLLPCIVRTNEAEKEWKVEKTRMGFGDYQNAADDLLALYPLLFYNYRYIYDCGRALIRNEEYMKSNEILTEGTKYSSDPAFHVLMGKNYECLNMPQSAREEYITAYFMVPARIYPLVRLMRLELKEGNDMEAIEVAEKILSKELNYKNLTMVKLNASVKETLDSLKKCNYVPIRP